MFTDEVMFGISIHVVWSRLPSSHLEALVAHDRMKRTITLHKTIHFAGVFGNIWDNVIRQLRNMYRGPVIFGHFNAETLQIVFVSFTLH